MSDHKKGMAYLAYITPYEAILIHPEEVHKSDGRFRLVTVENEKHEFIDLVRIPEKDRKDTEQ